MYSKVYYEKYKEAIKRAAKKYYLANREKISEKAKVYNSSRKEQIQLSSKISKLRRKYGLTLEKYQQMVLERNGQCDICQEVPKTLCVEHDHISGKIRGLVCARCNVFVIPAVEKFKNLLGRAESYLEKL